METKSKNKTGSKMIITTPGHSDISGNEEADRLACLASITHFEGPEPVLGVSSATVRNAIKLWSITEQRRLWKLASGCRQAKLMLREFNSGQANFALRLTRHTTYSRGTYHWSC